MDSALNSVLDSVLYSLMGSVPNSLPNSVQNSVPNIILISVQGVSFFLPPPKNSVPDMGGILFLHPMSGTLFVWGGGKKNRTPCTKQFSEVCTEQIIVRNPAG